MELSAIDRPGYSLATFLALLMFAGSGLAQQQAPTSSATVPRWVNFSGTAVNEQGKAISGIAGVTFAIYKDQSDGAPLWLETQNVTADAKGNYTVQLGATKPEGLPLDLFSTGEARWLGVRVNGGEEQPRVLLLSVPYALKAADAETIGGLPPSAFVMAAPVTGSASLNSAIASSAASTSGAPTTTSNVTTTGGTVNAIPLFQTATNIQNSILTQTGTTAVNVAGKLNLPATGTATATSGKNSQPLNLTASVFNSGTGTAVTQNFRWQAEPVGNDTSTAGGSLNLLYGAGSNTPAETGLKLSTKGLFTFAPGQKFPGTGTVTSVGLSAPGSDFTVSGSRVTTSGTLGLNWNIAPTSSATANAIVKRDANGSFSAGAISAVTSNAVAAVTGSNISTGAYGVFGSGTYGVFGQGTSTGVYGSGGIYGVYGQGINGVVGNGSSDSSSIGASGYGNLYGVYGSGGTDGVYASGTTYGVSAHSGTGSGVYGQRGTMSTAGGLSGHGGIGVWGDGGNGAWGVLGTVDEGYAGVFENDSPDGETLYAYNYDYRGDLFFAGGPVGDCIINNLAEFSCVLSSDLVLVDGGARKVALSAIVSPKNWFEDFGSAQLSSGAAVVAIDTDFAQTVNTAVEYRVFLTPNGDSHGLYLAKKTPTSFEVREQGGGTSSITFDYRIVALRKDYENIRFADHTNDPGPREMAERAKRMRQQVNPEVRPASSLVRTSPLHPVAGR